MQKSGKYNLVVKRIFLKFRKVGGEEAFTCSCRWAGWRRARRERPAQTCGWPRPCPPCWRSPAPCRTWSRRSSTWPRPWQCWGWAGWGSRGGPGAGRGGPGRKAWRNAFLSLSLSLSPPPSSLCLLWHRSGKSFCVHFSNPENFFHYMGLLHSPTFETFLPSLPVFTHFLLHCRICRARFLSLSLSLSIT